MVRKVELRILMKVNTSEKQARIRERDASQLASMAAMKIILTLLSYLSVISHQDKSGWNHEHYFHT